LALGAFLGVEPVSAPNQQHYRQSDERPPNGHAAVRGDEANRIHYFSGKLILLKFL